MDWSFHWSQRGYILTTVPMSGIGPSMDSDKETVWRESVFTKNKANEKLCVVVQAYVPGVRKLMLEGHKFKIDLNYIVRPCPNKQSIGKEGGG